MTGRCKIAGCGVILAGPEYAKVGADEIERNWAEFTALREHVLAHMMHFHPEELGVLHAHAADYMKTLCTKFIESTAPELEETRHDVSRLFYWCLMGDLLLTKSRPHPPMAQPNFATPSS